MIHDNEYLRAVRNLNPNNFGKTNKKQALDKISIHCMVSQLQVNNYWKLAYYFFAIRANQKRWQYKRCRLRQLFYPTQNLYCRNKCSN